MAKADKEIKDKDLKDRLEKIPPEERAAAWEQYVRDEVSSVLDTYLPEAVAGNIGIKYNRPVLRKNPKTGELEYDEKKATGVMVYLVFDFAGPIEFFDE